MSITATSKAVEGEWITTVARVEAPEGPLIVLSGVNSWDLKVFREGDGGAGDPLYELASQSPSLVMQAEAQIDGFWKDQPAPGYTFRDTIQIGSATFETEGGQSIVLEYRLNTANYGPVYITHHVSVQPRRSE